MENYGRTDTGELIGPYDTVGELNSELAASNAGDPLVAHDLIGYDGDSYIRIKGGRALYETVMVSDGYTEGFVRLVRIDTTNGIHQINRYVDPDTLVELVSA
jgi:hypothetical protein